MKNKADSPSPESQTQQQPVQGPDDDYFGPAIDATEQIRRWDAGRSVWSIEMGGLGPGYEQAIQVLAIEITRDNLNKPLPEPGTCDSDWGYDTVSRIDYKLPDGTYSCGGFSGAQVGAARSLAYQWLLNGPKAVHDRYPDDRRIQVSNTWPRAPRPAAVQSPANPDQSTEGRTGLSK